MVAEGEGAQVEALLEQRFRREAREAAQARARAEARARRAAEQAAAYERHLEQLASRKDETWQQVEKLTMFSKAKEYGQATQLLKDLHEIARREDDTTAFTARTSSSA